MSVCYPLIASLPSRVLPPSGTWARVWRKASSEAREDLAAPEKDNEEVAIDPLEGGDE